LQSKYRPHLVRSTICREPELNMWRTRRDEGAYLTNTQPKSNAVIRFLSAANPVFRTYFTVSKEKWTVIEWQIGATDVPFVDWDKVYHAPSAIFQKKGI